MQSNSKRFCFPCLAGRISYAGKKRLERPAAVGPTAPLAVNGICSFERALSDSRILAQGVPKYLVTPPLKKKQTNTGVQEPHARKLLPGIARSLLPGSWRMPGAGDFPDMPGIDFTLRSIARYCQDMPGTARYFRRQAKDQWRRVAKEASDGK